MLQAIYDALKSKDLVFVHLYWSLIDVRPEAHKQAFDVGYLHRNINITNILIRADGKGILCGWELALRAIDENGKPIVHTEWQTHRAVCPFYQSLVCCAHLFACKGNLGIYVS